MVSHLFGAKRRSEVAGLSSQDLMRANALLDALDARPGDLRQRRSLGDLYRAAGKNDLAVAQYQALVGAYATQGLLFRAIAACKLVLELHPDDEEATRALADLYGRRTSGRESSDLSPALGAALMAGDAGDEVLDTDAAGADLLPPPLPADANDDDGDVVDLDSLAAAMTLLPEGSVRVERPPSVPLFSGLSASSFAALLRELTAWEAEPNAIVVGEGEESDSVFIVVRGRVKVERLKNGVPVALATLGPDSFFGEMAILSKKPRAASVIAMERTELLEMPRAVLDALVAKDPSVAQALEAFARSRLLDNLGMTSPLLRDLPADTVQAALAAFSPQRVVAGTVLVDANSDGRGLFVVVQGEAEVLGQSELGAVKLKELGAGDVFGEMSLLSGEPTTAAVVARTDLSLLTLSRDDFGAFATRHPALAERLAQLAATRRAFNERFLPDATSSAVLV